MDIVEINATNVSEFAEDIARIHMTAYSRGHFTSTFGLRKLAEYNRFLVLNSDISLAAVDGRGLLGFIISGEAVSRGVSAFIRENRAFLVGRMLARPAFLFEKLHSAIRATLFPRRPSSASYRLLSIATAPTAQSGGVGALLLADLEARLRTRGVARYGLSVLTRNDRAVAFYLRNGFLHEKDEMGSTYFRKDLSTPSSGG